ncbi:hypothetical protein HMPREF0290_2841 [Corynebacterium efficiens YS-314]|nr:hypothetical protein HMPREF0290_2841 [Corynebacterium efficiens YS-314]
MMSTDYTDHPGASSTGDSRGSGHPEGSTLTKVLIFIIQPLVVVGGLLCFAGAVNGIFEVLEQLPGTSGDTAGVAGAVDTAWIRDELEIVLVYLIGMALLWGVSLAIQIYSRYLRMSADSTQHRGDDETTRNNDDTAGN